ncbi:uncharacterized protein LOC124487156 isoform X2 [Hypomesus transpacificus]|nr:uncharacterized protein LOC124487156 isoform X2 [Hypomesus transpacificus]XP_046905209.1 uncharacterized protein LOC124487156 isoform X2 [Hypomesus transpacificus]
MTLASIIHSDTLKTFTPGQTVDLECIITEELNYYHWFKLTPGQAPVCMVSFYVNSVEPTLLGEFNNKSRYTFRKIGSRLTMAISNAGMSDVGTYYCAVRNYDEITFGSGVYLMHEVSNSRSVVQQPVSESVQPGDSVTLNCTIPTETCSGEHSVYWFRHGSGESHPGILYTHGGRSDQCEKSPEAGSPTQSCVYNLPKRNLSLSDAGTYYCAVASCGEILFGNGTMLDVKLVDEDQMRILVLLSIIRTGVLLCCLIIFVTLYFKKK